MNEKKNTDQTDKVKNENSFSFPESLKRENPFRVPGNYFEQLPQNIQEKIDRIEESEKKVSMFTISRNKRIYISLAAASVLLLISLWMFWLPGESTTSVFPNISLEQLLDESPEIIEGMDESLLIETLLAGVNENIDFSKLDFSSDTVISDEGILDYLNDENFSTDLLYNL